VDKEESEVWLNGSKKFCQQAREEGRSFWMSKIKIFTHVKNGVAVWSGGLCQRGD
jgi:hypothetical protein